MPRALALVSGGLDSSVAVARMLVDGWEIESLHCSQEPIVGPEAEDKAAASLAHLRGDGSPLDASVRARLAPRLWVVPVADALARFVDGPMHRDYFVHMKRLFNAIGSRLAAELDCDALLTGENLGQVSSQTLGNVGAVALMADRPVLQPLLGWDKQEITDASQVLGTFDIAKGPEVCDVLGPSKPSTVASRTRLEAHEHALGGLGALVDAALAERRERSLEAAIMPA